MTALTIGMFDGVHRGHQLIFQRLKETGCPIAAVTFSNHPAEALGKPTPTLITPLPVKLALFKKFGIEFPRVLSFTKELALQSYEEFLRSCPPIRHLILGDGATIGRDRLGTPEALLLLGKKQGFTVQFIPKLLFNEIPISSSRIRALLEQGRLKEAEELLGHPYYLI